MLIDKVLQVIIEILLMPFVISRIPVIDAGKKLEGICSKLDIGVKRFESIISILLESKIEIITENNTTKPPTSKIVEIELEMLSPKYFA